MSTQIPFSVEDTQRTSSRQVIELSNPCANGKSSDGAFLSPCGKQIGVADASPLHSSVSTMYSDNSFSSQSFLDNVFGLLQRHPDISLSQAVESTSSVHGTH